MRLDAVLRLEHHDRTRLVVIRAAHSLQVQQDLDPAPDAAARLVERANGLGDDVSVFASVVASP